MDPDDTTVALRSETPAAADSSVASRLAANRTAYARRVTAAAGIPPGSALEAAFAAIPREQFVGPPPWKIVFPDSNERAVSSDPADLYQDVLVGLGSASGLNNGQPSLHALCIDTLAPQPGERVVHVGAGGGYYTCVLAMLVGAAGRVDAYEIEPDLAARAHANLAAMPQVAVHARSGAEGPLPACDILYVNAAAAEPLAVWLDALATRGRLLFPLAPETGSGAMLLVARGDSADQYAARFLCSVEFVPCIGAQDAQAAQALAKAFSGGGWRQVRSLHRNHAPDETAWCAGRGWWLGTDSAN